MTDKQKIQIQQKTIERLELEIKELKKDGNRPETIGSMICELESHIKEYKKLITELKELKAKYKKILRKAGVEIVRNRL